MACDTPRENVARYQYTKDERTHLCFALYEPGTSAFSMTNVPCTSEVEHEITIEESAARRR